jgi:ParB-like chromosome segregation protein Spo0J
MNNDKSHQTLAGEVRLVPINDVVVPEERMRQLGDITSIVASIQDVGVIEPIVLRRDTLELISGLHRLESVRTLGQHEILARLIDVSEVQAAMIEIDENLARVELTALERAEHMSRRKQLYEALHPEVKHGGAPGKAGGGKAKSKDARVASFAADTAKKTGLSQRTVQEDVQIAKLSPESKRVVKGTPLAGKKRELLALSRLPPKEQATVAQAVTSGEVTTVAEATQKPGDKRAALVKAIPANVRPEIVPRPHERVVVVTRTVTMPSKPCRYCGMPGESPFAFTGAPGRGPSGEVVEVSYQTEQMLQIKAVDGIISRVNAMTSALAALPPGEERSRLAHQAADVITKGLQALNGIVSPMLARVRGAA